MNEKVISNNSLGNNFDSLAKEKYGISEREEAHRMYRKMYNEHKGLNAFSKFFLWSSFLFFIFVCRHYIWNFIQHNDVVEFILHFFK